ncbi:Glycosyl hydrolase family 63, C-terminal [Dillenia turbinata]|uniref:Glycosyl hydrolase family 63, C-terminal n=1 Tax=Dillenia turbinata TaxID=194707 RepID=A0AAN8V2Z6_9MAGN
MNMDRWIPREKILGAEALRSHFRHKAKKFSTTESKEISFFLERAFVCLDAWFQWFNTTQSGESGPKFWETFPSLNHILL